MSAPSVFFVGTPEEVAHHAAPLHGHLQYQIVSPDQIVETASPGDVAVFTMEHFDRFRDACAQLKQKNVATLYLIDGILEWRNAWENREEEPACPWTMRPALAHKVAAIGRSQMRVLNEWGNDGKVELVGVPRFDCLAERTLTQNQDSGRLDNQSIVEAAEHHSNFRLLVMTAKWPGFTPEQVSNAIESLSDLKAWHEENAILPDGRTIEIVWRLTQGTAEQVGVENELQDLTGGDLHSVLANVDAVITTPSTAVLEAMLFDIPVAVLEYNNTPQYVPAAWQITAKQHIPTVIAELSQPPERKLHFQKACLNDSLECDGNAATRLASLISGMLEISAKQIAEGQSLSFPGPILAGDHYGDSHRDRHFCHERVYPSVEAFSQNDLVEVQAQLAHSRREISHLQREMAQLQSELDEAHGIFDQINQHPIAGPIVKARQKIIEWISRFRERSTADKRSLTSSSQKSGIEKT